MLHKAPVLEFSSTDEIYLVLDGTYFPNDVCLVVYRNFHLKLTQLYRISDGEHFQEIAEDLQNLLNLGIKIKSITSDGDKSSIKAIKKICPKVPPEFNNLTLQMIKLSLSRNENKIQEIKPSRTCKN
jgi:hypothetical protein